MADLSKLIENKNESAKFMMDEITHICRDMPKRNPGSEGEKMACEYMGEVMVKEGGADYTKLESFKENPGSFFGWIYYCVALGIAAFIANFFVPVVGIVLSFIALVILFLQFGLYKKLLDPLFKEETGHNMTAIKKPSGEVKARIFFNGHADACWLWPVNEKYGGIAHISQYIFGGLGLVYMFVVGIINTAMLGPVIPVMKTTMTLNLILSLIGFFFIPWFIALCFMWNEKIIVDGANDNLSGCYMGIAILKALKEQGIELEHTEIGVITTGSEEAGLRGAWAWAEAHKNDYKDVPTWIISYDTIREGKFLAANYRDLNATVALDKEVGDAFVEAADELGIKCSKGIIPPFGGATDAAAFKKFGGFKTISIGAMDYNLQPYYHTRKDTWTNLDQEALADCYAVSVKMLENFDKKYGE